MADFSILAVLVAALAAFVASGGYYAAFGQQLADVNGAFAEDSRMPPSKVALELLRSLVTAAVVAGLAARGDINTWTGGLVLGLVLWVGFPLVLWTGAIVHEKTPSRLAAIHGGDWLLKLLLIGAIVAAWQ